MIPTNAIDYFIGWLGLASIGTLALFGFDKWQAGRAGSRRVSEFTLLAACALGGWLGGLLGIIFFRHKSSKPSFLLQFFVAFVVFVFLGAGGLKDLAASPVVWGGLVLFGLSAVVWLFALSRVELSFAYPFAALGYVIIVLASLTVLHESVPPLRWAGVAFIIAGIILVARTA